MSHSQSLRYSDIGGVFFISIVVALFVDCGRVVVASAVLATLACRLSLLVNHKVDRGSYKSRRI